MSGAMNSPSRVDAAKRTMPSTLSDAVSLAPLPASEAVGRATGLGRAPLITRDPPTWRTAGIVGLIALVAAAALPVIASMLSLPL